jgi:hypothetical protein
MAKTPTPERRLKKKIKSKFGKAYVNDRCPRGKLGRTHATDRRVFPAMHFRARHENAAKYLDFTF